MTKEQIEYLNSLGVDFNQLSSLGTPEVPQVGDPPLKGGDPTQHMLSGKVSPFDKEEIQDINLRNQQEQGLVNQVNQMNLTGLHGSPVVSDIADTDPQKTYELGSQEEYLAKQMDAMQMQMGQKVADYVTGIQPKATQPIQAPDISTLNVNKDLVMNTADMGLPEAEPSALEKAGDEAMDAASNVNVTDAASKAGGGFGMGGINDIVKKAKEVHLEPQGQTQPDSFIGDNITRQRSFGSDKMEGSKAFGETMMGTGNWIAAGITGAMTSMGGWSKTMQEARDVKRNIEQAKFEAGRQDRASIYNDPNSVYYSGPKGYLA